MSRFARRLAGESMMSRVANYGLASIGKDDASQKQRGTIFILLVHLCYCSSRIIRMADLCDNKHASPSMTSKN